MKWKVDMAELAAKACAQINGIGPRMVYPRLTVLGLLLAWSVSLPAAEGAATYENLCTQCHGADGRARTPQGRKMKARDLRESRLTDAEIQRQIREGSRNKTGVSVMPPVGRELTEAEIQDLVRAVKAFRPAAGQP
jgi:mono/diheme cytochrome c family protein